MTPSEPAAATPSPGAVRITAVLQARGPAAAVVLTDDQVAEIGRGAKTPPVQVTVNDGYTFGGRIGRMKGESLLGFNKAVRDAAGVQAGDEITIDVVLEVAPRTIDVPPDLHAALATDPAALTSFEALAPSHRKEFVRWIEEAKRPETRDKRVAETLALVLAGKTRR